MGEASLSRTPRRSKKCKLAKPQDKIKNKIKFKKEGVSPLVRKYWLQRHNLFSRYDKGIKLDEEGWYSVTPEEIAIRHAERCGGRSVIDCFCGVGGNAIQFARMSYHVVAIDIDPQKVKLAFNNAKIYGVEGYIDFIVGDFFQLAPSLKGDIVFLAPPWGGPSYRNIKNFTLDLLKPKDGYSLFQNAQDITPNIIMFLPRNVDLQQVEELSWLSSPPLDMEIEENYVKGMLKGITVFFGDAAFWATELVTIFLSHRLVSTNHLSSIERVLQFCKRKGKGRTKKEKGPLFSPLYVSLCNCMYFFFKLWTGG